MRLAWPDIAPDPPWIEPPPPPEMPADYEDLPEIEERIAIMLESGVPDADAWSIIPRAPPQEIDAVKRGAA